MNDNYYLYEPYLVYLSMEELKLKEKILKVVFKCLMKFIEVIITVK